MNCKMVEIIQTMDWQSFVLGVVATIIFGGAGSLLIAILGEGI